MNGWIVKDNFTLSKKWPIIRDPQLAVDEKTWPIRHFCHIFIRNTVNVEARAGTWWLEGQWQCWETHNQVNSCMLWVFIGKEKALLNYTSCLFTHIDSPESRLSITEPPAAPEEWWICAFGLINWSNNQKLDGCGSNIRSIAFSVIQYFQFTNVQY